MNVMGMSDYVYCVSYEYIKLQWCSNTVKPDRGQAKKKGKSPT